MMTIKYIQDKINNPSISYTEKSIGQVNIRQAFSFILEAKKFLFGTQVYKMLLT